MAKSALLALTLVLGALGALQNHENTNSKVSTQIPTVQVESWVYDLFSHWTQKENKLYGSADEKNYRLLVFRNNVLKIRAHNNANKSWTLAINKFADLTGEEFKARYLTLKAPQGAQNIVELDTVDVPDSIDWRQQGIVGPVKDQGQCGSCWAFSAVAALEGLSAQKSGVYQSYSEQQLVDCSTNEGNEGCDGGLMDYAFQYVQSNGIETDKQYPYKARDQRCKAEKGSSAFQISGFNDVEPNNNQQLEAAVAQGVVSVAIEADTEVFQFYEQGIIDSEDCGTELDHGVVAVGYGKENGKAFWIVRNSWGGEWGDHGYVKILKESESSEGVCGIALAASYPTV